VHTVLINSWQRAQRWIVGRYVLMPNHLHFFCAPATHPAQPFFEWQFYWRWEASRHWPFPFEKPVWQKDFFDRQLRAGESYWAKWNYVRENPVRAGLVEHPDLWAWQGEIHPLPWHETS